jgi:aldose 1-epimerase
MSGSDATTTWPADVRRLELASGRSRLVLVPDLGGGIAEWSWQREGRSVPLFRPWDRSSADPYTFASFPLVPWSNRISGGGFDSAAGFVPLTPNRADDPYPIHGHGFMRPWKVSAHLADRAELVLESAPEDVPWRYRAVQRLELDEGRLTHRLSVTHLGPEPMPYGLGLHPYFPRSATTRLSFAVTGAWESRPDRIPLRLVEPPPAEWDFRGGRLVEGDALIDNCFTGWDGQATIDLPEEGVALTLRSRTPYLLLYRPPDFPFFCLEPVTHPIDAIHLPGRPGVVELETGRSLELVMEIEVVERR